MFLLADVASMSTLFPALCAAPGQSGCMLVGWIGWVMGWIVTG